MHPVYLVTRLGSYSNGHSFGLLTQFMIKLIPFVPRLIGSLRKIKAWINLRHGEYRRWVV